MIVRDSSKSRRACPFASSASRTNVNQERDGIDTVRGHTAASDRPRLRVKQRITSKLAMYNSFRRIIIEQLTAIDTD